MKIVELRAENFKRLRAVEIKPASNVVVISGANEQGKTSVLDAIWAAIDGSEWAKTTGTVKPIREGEGESRVIVDLGDIVVTRKWNGSGTSLTVENKDGAVFKSPQGILDNILGKIAFDPLSFAAMKDREQKETLLSLVDLGIDLDKLAEVKKDIYDKRAHVNRDVKVLSGSISSVPDVPEGTPDQEVSTAAALAEIKLAHEKISENYRKRIGVMKSENLVAGIESQCKIVSDEIKRKQEEIESLTAKKNGLLNAHKVESDRLFINRKEVDSVADPDIDALQNKVDQIETVNESVRLKIQTIQAKNKLSDMVEESKNLTAEMEAIDKKKADALLAAKFPIDGLGFNDSGVTFKGIPFSQCSSAERLRTSIAMAMAMNPKLRVIRITDGSLIDSKNMKIIEEMVREKDFQIWIEKVDETGKVGVYIEDGEVKANNSRSD
jgi:hypothetical protein